LKISRTKDRKDESGEIWQQGGTDKISARRQAQAATSMAEEKSAKIGQWRKREDRVAKWHRRGVGSSYGHDGQARGAKAGDGISRRNESALKKSLYQ